jgi:hypothetical protein
LGIFSQDFSTPLKRVKNPRRKKHPQYFSIPFQAEAWAYSSSIGFKLNGAPRSFRDHREKVKGVGANSKFDFKLTPTTKKINLYIDVQTLS